MLGNRRLVADALSEVYPALEPYVDERFYQLKDLEITPGSVCVISREQLRLNTGRLGQLVKQATVVLANPFEGSTTLVANLREYGVLDLVTTGHLLVVSGSQQDFACVDYDYFATQILTAENQQAIADYRVQPDRFLFLNGRGRAHRGYLLNRLRPVLDQALWTNLDSQNGPQQSLPAEYEVAQAHAPAAGAYLKPILFGNQWLDNVLTPKPYEATAFSLVTETAFDGQYSFRTEKTWKPIAIGHPFVVAANPGYYRDLHRLGFQTYHTLIDESFDLIDNSVDRLERIAQVVEDLCQQDLDQFVHAAQPMARYNQQHLQELAPQIHSDLAARLAKFVQPAAL